MVLPEAKQEAVISWILSDEPPISGFWRVEIALADSVVLPGSSLDLSVTCDHDGFVWIFTEDSGRAVLLYPQESDEKANRHNIAAKASRAVPGPDDDFGIQAGLEEGTELLMVLVTAENSKATSWRHLAALRPDLSVKPAPLKTGDWGSTQISYRVTR